MFSPGLKRFYERGLSFLHTIRPFEKQKNVILLYHNVCNGNRTVSKELFLEQMIFLKNNYKIIPLNELVACLKGYKAVDQDYAAVTFDDGHRDNFEIAYPVLKRLNISATMYLTAGYLDSHDNKYPSWDMVKEVVDSGLISIGNHTYSHPVLSSLKKDAQEQEIRLGRRILEDKLGIRITSFAYPFGQPIHYTSDTIDVLREDGYDFAVVAFPKKIDNPISTVYEIPRIPIDGINSLKGFEVRLSQFWGIIKWYLMRVRRQEYY